MSKWDLNDDLIMNPSPRIPICLCIDLSRSMLHFNRIGLIKDGIISLYEELKKDFQISNSAEVAIVTFNNEAELLENFETVSEKKIPNFTVSGNTALGKGVNLSINVLEERKKLYKENGVEYYQPWLIIFTDGASYGESRTILQQAQNKCFGLEYSKKLVVLPISVGSQAKKEELQKFTSKKNAVIEVEGAQFEKFFKFISQSVYEIVQSSGKAEIDFDLNSTLDWGEL
jgi:uncharacterized protein YegL